MSAGSSGLLGIGAAWLAGAGQELRSADPVTDAMVYSGAEADAAQVAAAVGAAQAAQSAWAQLGSAERLAVLERATGLISQRAEALALGIAQETGKPLWDARQEVQSVVAKLAATRGAWDRAQPVPDGAVLHRRPLGVVAVLGPFNFPLHLPHGQMLPALLAGNAVVFKPSERTPACGEVLVRCYRDAGLPPGVLNLVQGGANVGATLVDDPRLCGLFFTGSARGGEALHRRVAGRTDLLLALEMGGNNPLVVWDAPPDAATVRLIILSAFLSAGQRCTCARRLIIPADRRGEALLEALLPALRRIRVGHFQQVPEPFMGPVLDDRARAALWQRQEQIAAAGRERVLLPLDTAGHDRLVTPGLADATGLDLPDEELFGPLLAVQRARDFDHALALANATRYGLAAALLDPDAGRWQQFAASVRAGVINRNRQTTGASGLLPFGGLGRSGNHRPAGAAMVEACHDPVSCLTADTTPAPTAMPGLE